MREIVLQPRINNLEENDEGEKEEEEEEMI